MTHPRSRASQERREPRGARVEYCCTRRRAVRGETAGDEHAAVVECDRDGAGRRNWKLTCDRERAACPGVVDFHARQVPVQSPAPPATRTRPSRNSAVANSARASCIAPVMTARMWYGENIVARIAMAAAARIPAASSVTIAARVRPGDTGTGRTIAPTRAARLPPIDSASADFMLPHVGERAGAAE